MPHLNKNTETRKLVHSFKKKWKQYKTHKESTMDHALRIQHWTEIALLCIEKKHYSAWPQGHDSLGMSYKMGIQDLNTEYMKGQRESLERYIKVNHSISHWPHLAHAGEILN